jgi:uncharacterized protein (TIGR03435 family)
MAAAMTAVWAAFAQGTAPASFDVASIKPAAPCCAAGQWRESKAGEDRIDFRYVTLRYCVAFAYRLKEYQVFGPAWAGETRYDIVAKGPEGTRHDQLPDMMQQLLVERFKLRVQHEKKEFNVFVLTVGKSGPKLEETPPESVTSDGASVGISMAPEGVGRIEVKHGNMTSLAGTLARIIGRPVVDLTGLTARYDFDLEYTREDAGATMMLASSGSAPTAEFGASVFSSIQRLGLKLEGQKLPQDSIVIERAEKTPTEN